MTCSILEYHNLNIICKSNHGFMLNFTKYRKGFDIMAKKVTSLRVAKQASKVLKDGRSSKRSKTIAGSVLSQREKEKK